jgi:general secretion pathway protein A
MYTSFFGLNEKPFSITPDPRYLFMSERHTEAFAHLLYGVRESGGFIQLTGEVGTGKTTLVRSLLQQVPDNAEVAVILNPQISRNEFLSAICEELGVPLPHASNNIKTLTSALNEYLLENHSKGKRTILLVDEAQNLRLDVLEQVRLLTNLETTKQKLLQIILIAQPELREILSRNDMRQLAQRITGRYHLEPLSREETAAYIDHRLKVAGAVGPIFSKAAKQALYRLSKGVPRMINVIADRAMLGAFTQETREITPALLNQAAAEVFGKDSRLVTPWRRWRTLGIGIAAAIAVATVAVQFFTGWPANMTQTTVRPIPAPENPVLKTPQSAPATQDIIIDTPLTTATAETPDSSAILVDGLADILAENPDTTDTDSAFATLFGLWGIDYTSGNASVCKEARNKGLHCKFLRGSLSQVRNLNRPVILTLHDQNGQQHQVVLAELAHDIASIAVADSVYDISTAELGEYWYGQYLVLWQPQIDTLKQFVPGMRDADVRWLRKSLAEIQGEPVPPMDSDLFDQDLETRVRDYQRQRRLTSDGVVGYQTQIAINTDLSTFKGPRLSRAD